MCTVNVELILCIKVTSCTACRQVDVNFMFAIDLPVRHHSARLLVLQGALARVPGLDVRFQLLLDVTQESSPPVSPGQDKD